MKAGGKQGLLLVIYFHAGFLLGLFSGPDDGGGMFLRNGN
jgi:hypothetical protein